MQIAKWGNSFAVRIPKDVMRSLNLREGDNIELRAAADGCLEILPDQRKQAALERLKALRIKLPEDWKFDREEANER